MAFNIVVLKKWQWLQGMNNQHLLLIMDTSFVSILSPPFEKNFVTMYVCLKEYCFKIMEPDNNHEDNNLRTTGCFSVMPGATISPRPFTW